MSTVMTLVVPCLLGCVFSTILVGPPYIPQEKTSVLGSIVLTVYMSVPGVGVMKPCVYECRGL